MSVRMSTPGRSDEDDDDDDEEGQRSQKKLFHPFSLCLAETDLLENTGWNNLTQVALACWAMGMLTLFRPSFVLILSVISRIKVISSEIEFVKHYAVITSCLWFAIVMIVIFPLGLIPMFANSIKKRWVLLIHPWALMVLYFDVMVWLAIATLIYVHLCMVTPSAKNTIKQVKHSIALFVAIYIDIFVYFILHYLYVTCYIVAELAIIEKFY